MNHPVEQELSYAAHTPARRLARARQVLGGLNANGTRTHPSMFDPEVISFAHGEGVRRPHFSVLGAGISALLDTDNSSIDNYMFLQRNPELAEALAREFELLGIPTSSARQLCINSGTTPICLSFISASAEPGALFLSPRPYYHPLASWAELSCIELQCIATRRCNDYKLTSEDLEEWWARAGPTRRQRLRGVFLFNPSTTGAVYKADELDQLTAFIEQRDLVVLEDAIFSRTEFHTTQSAHLAARPRMAERVVTVNGGSKAHGLANLRIGWACGPQHLIDRMQYHAVATTTSVPQIAQAMAVAALRAPHDYLLENNRECYDRARLIEGLVAQINAGLIQKFGGDAPNVVIEHRPVAGHSILISLNSLKGLSDPDGRTIRDSIDITRYFLAHAHVAVSPGLSLGFDRCELRLSFGCVGSAATYRETRRAELETAVEAVARYFPPKAPIQRGSSPERSVRYTRHHSTPRGFAEGRRLIREALMDRVAPSIARLIETNRNNLWSGRRA